MDYTADGKAYLEFLHEMQYRSELFLLNGKTSAIHGVTRPLRLRYFQQKAPATRCCSHCGEPDHQAHACPLKASLLPSAEVVMDSGLPHHPPDRRAGVCRDCYSPNHQGTCDTNPASVTCKLCKETGHTSFHCKQFRPQWVPLSLPAVTHPMSTRPLVIRCIQLGQPWSEVVAPAPRPQAGPTPPPMSAFPPLPSSAPPRARPSAEVASPTVSTSSAAVSQPHSPTSPSSPATDERFIQQALFTMRAEFNAFQERQALQFQHFQQQLQQQQQQLQAQLQSQLLAHQEYIDKRFFALLSQLGASATPSPQLPMPIPPMPVYMQTEGMQPPPSVPTSLPQGQPLPPPTAPVQPQPQVSVTQSGANFIGYVAAPHTGPVGGMSISGTRVTMPQGANPATSPLIGGLSTPQPPTSSTTPSIGPVSRPQ